MQLLGPADSPNSAWRDAVMLRTLTPSYGLLHEMADAKRKGSRQGHAFHDAGMRLQFLPGRLLDLICNAALP